MSLSAEFSAVESFKFHGKNIRIVNIKDVGQCFVSIDLSRVNGYTNDNNGRRVIQRHVHEIYKFQLGDVETDTTQPNMIFLIRHDLRLFLIRCRNRNVFDASKHFDIKIEHCLPLSRTPWVKTCRPLTVKKLLVSCCKMQN